MALTPDDVVNKSFEKTKFREGYDQDQVDDFLDEVVIELRRLAQENEQLRERVTVAESKAADAVRSLEPAKSRAAQVEQEVQALRSQPAPARGGAVGSARLRDRWRPRARLRAHRRPTKSATPRTFCNSRAACTKNTSARESTSGTRLSPRARRLRPALAATPRHPCALSLWRWSKSESVCSGGSMNCGPSSTTTGASFVHTLRANCRTLIPRALCRHARRVHPVRPFRAAWPETRGV